MTPLPGGAPCPLTYDLAATRARILLNEQERSVRALEEAAEMEDWESQHRATERSIILTEHLLKEIKFSTEHPWEYAMECAQKNVLAVRTNTAQCARDMQRYMREYSQRIRRRFTASRIYIATQGHTFRVAVCTLIALAIFYISSIFRRIPQMS
jgi:hypothetical protein